MGASDHRPGRVALLIDADNLSADVIEQAIEHLLKNHGAIHFRRAYCSPQKAMELTDIFRRHAIRPMVNVPTGKNSTDIALAVDAIDLALTERPDVVVIASSDSDYAPLAQRLREKGCRVLGIGQAGKTGSESPLAYDGFVDLAHRSSRSRGPTKLPSLEPVSASEPPARAARPSSRAGAVSSSRQPGRQQQPSPPSADRSTARSTDPTPSASTRPTSTRPRPVRGGARGGRVAAPSEPSTGAAGLPAEASLPPEVAAILDAVPELRAGGLVDLNGIGASLRQHDLLQSRNASPSRLLKRHAAHFELLPADKPRTVRYLETAALGD